jgi:hypothetical protein
MKKGALLVLYSLFYCQVENIWKIMGFHSRYSQCSKAKAACKAARQDMSLSSCSNVRTRIRVRKFGEIVQRVIVHCAGQGVGQLNWQLKMST